MDSNDSTSLSRRQIVAGVGLAAAVASPAFGQTSREAGAGGAGA